MKLLPLALASLLRSSVPSSAAYSLPSIRSFDASSTELASTALGYRKHPPDVSTSDIVDLSPKEAVVSTVDPRGSNAVATSPEEGDTDQVSMCIFDDGICILHRTLSFS